VIDPDAKALIESSGIPFGLVESARIEGDRVVVVHRSYFGLGDDYEVIESILSPGKTDGGNR